jgi:hypothetical protein
LASILLKKYVALYMVHIIAAILKNDIGGGPVSSYHRK